MCASAVVFDDAQMALKKQHAPKNTKKHHQAKYLAATTGKTEDEVMRDFARPRYFTPFEAVGYGLIDAVLEPKDGKALTKDWDALGSEIGDLSPFDDDEQPLPANVMYSNTSDYWRNDDAPPAAGGSNDKQK